MAGRRAALPFRHPAPVQLITIVVNVLVFFMILHVIKMLAFTLCITTTTSVNSSYDILHL